MDSILPTDWTGALIAGFKNTEPHKLLFGVIIAIVLIRVFGIWPQKRNKNLVRVPGYPIIGNLLLFIPGKAAFPNVTKVLAKYGSFLEMWIFNHRIIAIGDLKMIKECLAKRPKTFRRTKGIVVPGSLLGFSTESGTFFAEGEAWSRQRRLTSPAFSHKNIELMSPAIANEIDNFISRLKSLEVGEVTRMDHQTFSYTIRVIGAVAFGSYSQASSEYFFSDALISDIHAIFEFMIERLIFPFPGWMWALSPNYYMEKAALFGDGRLNKNCLILIEAARKSMGTFVSSDSTSRKCLVENLISIKVGGEAPLTDNEILSNVKIFYLGGSDTTSVVMAWCIYHLCLDKVMLKRLQVEVDSILGLDMTGADAMAAASSLPYCSAVFKEALRMKSPVEDVMMSIVGDEPVTLSNGIQIFKDDDIFIHVESVLLNNEIFPNADKFDPSRWLVSEQDPVKLLEMENAFVTFGYGPRVCPGQALAFAEGISGLAAIIRNFNFELACPVSEIKRVCDFVTKINKLPVILERRTK